MTALMAAIGLLPAAVSTGIGSETGRPLAIVIIGGLTTATILTLLVFPLIYYRAFKKKFS
jgi:cobalt-zinc-cadmium resistance protein CzcA